MIKKIVKYAVAASLSFVGIITFIGGFRQGWVLYRANPTIWTGLAIVLLPMIGALILALASCILEVRSLLPVLLWLDKVEDRITEWVQARRVERKHVLDR